MKNNDVLLRMASQIIVFIILIFGADSFSLDIIFQGRVYWWLDYRFCIRFTGNCLRFKSRQTNFTV